MTSPKITVIINTYNEAGNIKDCIESAKLLTSNIIVIDTESTDNTTSIAKQLSCKTFAFPRSYYVEPVRQFSLDQVQSGWIFILDADERITQELAQEINNNIDSENTHFKITRKNIFAHSKWLKHGGWWPDYQIRLFSKESFVSWPQKIHSTPKFVGKCGKLQNPIIHYIHNGISEMVEKTVLFENIESELLFKAGKTVKTSTFFRKFAGELYRRLFKHAGFLDGPLGIIESLYQAYSKTITYIYLYEKKKSSSV